MLTNVVNPNLTAGQMLNAMPQDVQCYACVNCCKLVNVPNLNLMSFNTRAKQFNF